MATDANRQLFDQIRGYLEDMNLGGLFVVDSNGAPGGWLWEQITNGIDNEAALQIAVEQTSQFQARYGIIGELRNQAGSGAAVHVPNVAEVREYEQRVASMMRQAGLPSFMYDNWQDSHDLMRQGLSVVEIEQRLGQAWERVQNTEPAVRDAFSSFYGTMTGDAALAATFLDPTRTLSALERESRAAYTAGMGQRIGVSIDQQLAERFADTPQTDAGIYQSLTALNALDKSGVMTETIGEAANNLTTQGAGVDSVLGGNNAEIERRIIERQAARAAVPGGAVRTNRGLSGASSTGGR